MRINNVFDNCQNFRRKQLIIIYLSWLAVTADSYIVIYYFYRFRMGCTNKILRLIILTVCICIFLSHRQYTVKGTPTNSENHPPRNRANRFATRLVAPQYARTRNDPDFLRKIIYIKY